MKKSAAQKLAERWGLDFFIKKASTGSFLWVKLCPGHREDGEVQLWLALVKADKEISKSFVKGYQEGVKSMEPFIQKRTLKIERTGGAKCASSE
jgi:hypothetical protein